MNSLTTILMASAVVAEEWRQTNRSRPMEGYHLAVMALLPRPWRAEDPDDMEPARHPEGPSESLRMFLALEEARHQLSVRPFPAPRGTRRFRTSLGEVVMDLSSLRRNMVSYEALYPAAVEVRNSLGDEIWDGLEDCRGRVAYLTLATIRLQRTDPRLIFPEGVMEFLDDHIHHMGTYVRTRWGENDWDLFWCVHENLDDPTLGYADRRTRRTEIQKEEQMQSIKFWFRSQPIFLLAYNLYFPVHEKMSWEQVSMWAIRWLRRTNMEAPAWPLQLRGLHVWNPETTAIWNRAVLEMLTDIRRRFRATHTLQ